ncbi:glycosyltransferase [Puniceicoccus vermicola]|uniref:Glycosyltransferase n=1 Tax=Puniceicoccus vermicola TaxID=388746 RepID=A0A7X1E5F7_9BACT|nr:glycosyltransferase [Puniceicoccus vermicola]MBC2603605.1 glycosyltransferase [Puniceicoccus vermicola]
MNSVSFRWILFLAGAICLAVGCLPFSLLESVEAPSLGRVYGYALQGIGLTLCWGFFPLATTKPKQSILLILGLSVALRLLLFPAPASDDLHRYRWEGKLTISGEIPFAQPADDPSLANFRDADWERMNHKDKGTIYPPLAQLTFGSLALISSPETTPIAEKVIFSLADLGTIFLVLVLLRKRRLPLSYSLFYAVNPITLLSFAGEAHYDSLFILPLVGSIVALESGRSRLSWVLLAVSIQFKLISLIILPIWILRRQFRGIALGIGVLLIPWIPFLGGIPAWTRSVAEFGGSGTFQGLIPFLLRALNLSENLAPPIGGILFLSILGWTFYKGGAAASIARRSFCALILCSPVIHFWYLAWILPFVALRPSLSWLWLCASQALYFLVWPQYAKTGYWELPPIAETVIWLPFLLIGIWEFNRIRSRCRVSPAADSLTETSLGIVIPTYNAGQSLERCLQSIKKSSQQPHQCIVVDGGSSDETIAIADRHRVPVLQSELGRGQQVQAGIIASNTDWILILHADCELHPQAIESISNLEPEIAGGGCGQRFSPGNCALTLVEFLNEGRAVLGESYWGDQGMFLRRKFKSVWSTLHQFPLMEDVELSRLIRRAGETCYLGLETRSESNKWSRGNKFSRLVLVFSLVIRFRIAALFGRHATIAGNLYRRYYNG